MELRYFQISTVEQLAAVNDVDAQKIPGMINLKNQAAAYLEQAEKHAGPSRLASEVEDLKSKLLVSEQNREQLIQRVDELQAQISALENISNDARKRTRK